MELTIHAITQSILLLFCIAITAVESFRDLYLDFPGPYCARRGGCCDNRQDNCSVPITTTLCYCDDFCDRNRGADCCPDFLTYCRSEPQPIIRCVHKGKFYDYGQSFKDNCNTCKCGMRGTVDCENDTCLVDEAIVNNINSISSSIGWEARNYSEFWGRKFREGLKLRLGTLEPSYKVRAMTRISNGAAKLPRHFNSLDHFSGLISEVKDQSWCGSSWVVSTTSVASDRFAIMSKGKEMVQLSPQHILSCARRQRGCNGGHLDAAWRFLHKQGVVDEECFPYEARVGQCRLRRIHSLSVAGCRSPLKVKRDHFYAMGPVYPLNNVTDIMIEILDNGPVQATLRVYRDFFSYSGGIYRHSKASRSEEYGFHSVRLMGWGEERIGYETVKYWIAANSWGTWWGEKGYFRILRGQNECKIEEYVLASLPHVYDVSRTANDNRI